jgi:nicotinate-nucleotide--dimethylbenzimidazole phosphoribosyltransferase
MFMSVLTVWPTLAPAADEAAMASDTAAETVAQVEEELVVPEAAMLEAPEAGGVGGGIEEEAEMMAADEASDSADMESFAAETDAATSRAAPAAEAAPGIASAELQTAPDEDAAASAADAVMADEALPAPESTPAAEALAAPVDESGDEALAREVADSAESPPPAERTTVTAAPIGEPEPAPLTVALIVTGIVSLLLIGLLLFVRSRVDDKL